ncbi:hypothetical protein H0I68_20435, partial [Yersinia kristensenii]|nr:hypothetical protein [Yersinia kristensenii]
MSLPEALLALCATDEAEQQQLISRAESASSLVKAGKVPVHGILTRLKWLSTSSDQSHYRVRLESRLALLSR